jgi:outer membrane immunogenic protein
MTQGGQFWGMDKLRVSMATCAFLAAVNLAWAADSPTAPAAAANQLLPPAPVLPYSWAGFYIRGSGDLGLGQQTTGANAFDGLLSVPSAAGLSGGLASGEIGANWQTGNTVIGVEGDMQWSSQWASPLDACGLGCSLNDRVRVPWLATLRARAGKAFDRVFIYGTGGFASQGMSDNLNPAGYGATPNFVNLSAGNINWMIGGGMEMALDHNVSAKIEYLHMQSSFPAGAPESLFDSTSTDAKNDILRGGINYRFPIGQ